MSGYVQTAVEGIWIVAVFVGVVSFIGYGATRLLLPEEWRGYRILLTPVVGWSLLTLASFAVNMVVGMQLGIWVILTVALLVNLGVFLRSSHRSKGSEREPLLPFFFGVGLVVFGLIPHIAQRSLSLLSLNQDEEIYYPAANYILMYPTIGGPHRLSELFLSGISAYGWAFQYSMAAASGISGSTSFDVYFPVSYTLLGLSVPALYLFFREVLGLRHRAAVVGCFFYTLLGLPLWFAFYGYGPQMGSLVAAPAGIAAFVVALRRGGMRRYILGALIVAAGLTSYYKVIALQYIFVCLPIVAVAAILQRSRRPIVRAVVVAALALVLGLPSHWHMVDYYFIKGGIESDFLNGGWGIKAFQPLPVMLGLDAFQIMHDGESTGPLASFDGGLNLLAVPVAWLLLALAVTGLLASARTRPIASAAALGTGVYLAFTRYVQVFPYGYMKLMPIAAPIAYALASNVVEDQWQRIIAQGHRPAAVSARVVIAGSMVAVTILLAYNTYEAVWFNASGWGQSIPNWVNPDLRDMGRIVKPGSSVFVTGRYEYPVPPDRIQPRQNTLGMRSDKEQRQTWAQRIRVMALTNLLHANVYGYFENRLVFSHPNRLLDNESYDYYLMGTGNDPRLDGLDPQDIVWSDPGLVLYSSRNVVRNIPWTLMKERGSLAITPSAPLIVGVSAGEIRADGSIATGSQPGRKGRLRIGILAFSRTEATVQMDDAVRHLILEPGITWYTTPNIPIPSKVMVRPNGESSLGLVALRLLGEGNEEKDLVPANTIGDTVYASSTVLPLKDWLTDPFDGKKPGTE